MNVIQFPTTRRPAKPAEETYPNHAGAAIGHGLPPTAELDYRLNEVLLAVSWLFLSGRIHQADALLGECREQNFDFLVTLTPEFGELVHLTPKSQVLSGNVKIEA